jgi:hypothetical protein
MPQRSGWFTLTIGGITVPLNLMSSHLGRRGTISYVEEGEAAFVSQVLESAPIGILAVVGGYPETSSPSDLFTHPQYASIREWRPLSETNAVIFSRDPRRAR